MFKKTINTYTLALVLQHAHKQAHTVSFHLTQTSFYMHTLYTHNIITAYSLIREG